MHGENSLAAICADPRFKIVRGDVRCKSTMMLLLKDADAVIPLAALVGAPLCKRDPVAAEGVNRDAIKMMVKMLSKSQRILMPVTNSGYGIGKKNAYCTEKSPLKPLTLYGRTKVEAEKIILGRENSISFRLATVFGMSPRMRLDLLVNDFVYRAVRDRFIILFEGHFRRNYLHVRDVARVFQFGLENFAQLKGEAYNVGLSDANLSKMDLCRRIQKQLPDFVIKEAAVGKDPDKRDYIVSNDKIESAGFKPRYSLDDGIRELIKGYKMMPRGRFAND
jgi:nucleoside-diphosphate-sugar epimerase